MAEMAWLGTPRSCKIQLSPKEIRGLKIEGETNSSLDQTSDLKTLWTTCLGLWTSQHLRDHDTLVLRDKHKGEN